MGDAGGFDTKAEAIADANRRVPSRTEAEAVRLLMEEWEHSGLLHPVQIRELLASIGMVTVVFGQAQPDWDAYRRRYREEAPNADKGAKAIAPENMPERMNRDEIPLFRKNAEEEI